MVKERVRVKPSDKDDTKDQDQAQPKLSKESVADDKGEPDSGDDVTQGDEEETEKPKTKPKAKAKQPEPEEEDDEDEEEEAEPIYTREPVGTRVTALAGVDSAPTPNVEDFDEEDTVPMMFPVAVHLQHEGIMHNFEKGIHNVPLSISTHWYLKHNKVKKFKGR